jgi:O-methyltransferase involved in polyketide biosynthesis
MAKELSPVERTCRITAGFRAVEQEYHGSQSIIHDPLAGHLAGEDALQLAERELTALTASQGPGKPLAADATTRVQQKESAPA